jgi:RNA polymerase sigma factor (sigma-70 family)
MEKIQDERDSRQVYLGEIQQIPQLSLEEEIALSNQLLRARQRLLEVLLSFEILRPFIFNAAKTKLENLTELGAGDERQNRIESAQQAVTRLAGSLEGTNIDVESLASTLPLPPEFAKEMAEAILATPGSLREESALPLPNLSRDDKAKIVPQLRPAAKAMDQVVTAFVTRNLRLSVFYVRKFCRFSKIDFDDLVQEANLGLIRAVEKFEPQRDLRFSTYAMYWIRHKVSRYEATNGELIRVSHQLHERQLKVKQSTKRLEQRYGRSPTLNELAESLNETTEDLRMILDLPTCVASTPFSGDEEGTDLLELYEDPDQDTEEGANNQLAARWLESQIKEHLSRDEEVVLRSLYGFGVHHDCGVLEASKMLGYNTDKIRDLQRSAISKLRSAAGTYSF